MLSKWPIPGYATIENVGIYFLVLLLLFHQRRELSLNNMDSLSIVILILGYSPFWETTHSDTIRFLLRILGLTVALCFANWFHNQKDREKLPFFLHDGLNFAVGLLVGLAIAIFKVQVNHLGLLTLAVNYPIHFGSALLAGFSTLPILEEFAFRGFLWGYLRRKGWKNGWIILFSAFSWSFVWVFIQGSSYQVLPNLINYLFLGIILGVLTWKTKSISASIAAHAAYNSFLIFQMLYFK